MPPSGFRTTLRILSFVVLIAGVVLGLKLYYQTPSQPITSFEECARAGYPILETYPEQCRTPDGKNFVATIPSNQNDDLTSYGDPSRGVSFRYLKPFPTTYIKAEKWPPTVSVSDDPFSCEEAVWEMPSAGTVQLRMIGDRREYCVRTSSDGAAGSIYRTYEYSTPKNGKVVFVAFTLREVQCGVFDELERLSCEAERRAFSLDSVVDAIVETVVWR